MNRWRYFKLLACTCGAIICTSADIICNVVRTFLALGFPPYLTYSKEGKQTNNYWNRKNPQKVHLLLAYLLSNVFNECLLFLALLVFQPKSFILYEIKITNLSSQKKSSTFWEDDQPIKYLDYLFLLFLFGFFRRLIRGLLLRRHDGGQADFPANCARSVHITQSSLQSSGRKNGGKITVLCPGPLGCGHLNIMAATRPGGKLEISQKSIN